MIYDCVGYVGGFFEGGGKQDFVYMASYVNGGWGLCVDVRK